MSDYLEVEVKLYVANLRPVEQRLKEAHAALVMPRTFEYNVRYENAENTLTAQSIVIRLRRDQKIRLTYKEPTEQIDSEIQARFEAEVEIDDMKAMGVILEKLGYHPQVIYEKYRTTYELEHTEVVLDEMPYGNFVEIEGKPDDIRRVIGLLGLEAARQYRTNYIQMFENVRRNLDLDVPHLTFEHFNGVDVPQTAFEPPDGEVRP